MATRDELVAAIAERYARSGSDGARPDPGRVRGGDAAFTASMRCVCFGLASRAAYRPTARRAGFMTTRCARR